MKKEQITATVMLAVGVVIVALTAINFRSMKIEEVIVDGPGVTRKEMLSDYFPTLKDTNGDTEIYVLEGEEPGGSMLVLGGTHPNEPSGYIGAISMIENVTVPKGTLYVIPRANASAFTHNDPQEGSPQSFRIQTDFGEREFRYGSRATNPIDQWPDPDVYIHASSGQQLSGSETRNLNRAYPGKIDGNFTEKVAYGIVQLIKEKEIDMTVDLHEASPEYPVINAIVYHQNAMDVASPIIVENEIEHGFSISAEISPTNLHGLTHRELGDFTDTFAVLMETSNPSQGRMRGKTDEKLVLTGIDKYYEIAGKFEKKQLYVPFDETGHPLEQRVGRHTSSVFELSKSMSELYPDKEIILENMPLYQDLMDNGVGKFLLNPNN